MSTSVDDTAVNPYLIGNYAPVTEEVTALDLPVIGELPPELNGRYLRNGPNPIGEVDPAVHHWFIGDGMVHGIRLRDGRAEWYRNRYVGSTIISEARGEPDIPGRNWNSWPGGPNTNVGGFAGTTWAMVEAGGCPVELTYELETVGRNDFHGTLPGAFTAHPKIDPETGEMHAMTYAWNEWLDHIQYVRVGTDGRVNRTVDIPLPGMTMVHDMSITDRYLVVYDQPVLVDLDLAFAGRRFPFRWNDDYGNRIGLLPREGTAADIVWIDVPVGYVFHPLNAYDTPEGGVVLDLCFYDRMMRDDLRGPFGDSLPRLVRWEVDPVARTVSATTIDENVNEFPRHRGSLTGKPYRYGYCAQVDPGSMHWPTVKHDLTTGRREVFDHGPGRAAVSRSSSAGPAAPTRTTAGSSPSSTRTTRRSSWSWTRRTSGAATSPEFPSHSGSPSASTATGPATGSERSGSPHRERGRAPDASIRGPSTISWCTPAGGRRDRQE